MLRPRQTVRAEGPIVTVVTDELPGQGVGETQFLGAVGWMYLHSRLRAAPLPHYFVILE